MILVKSYMELRIFMWLFGMIGDQEGLLHHHLKA